MRQLGKQKFSQQTRRFDIPPFSHPALLGNKLFRRFHMLEYLVTNDIIKLLILKRKIFTVCLDKCLVRIDFHIPATVIIRIDKLFGNHIRAHGRIVPRPNLQHPVTFLDMQITPIVWRTYFHKHYLLFRISKILFFP